MHLVWTNSIPRNGMEDHDNSYDRTSSDTAMQYYRINLVLKNSIKEWY